VQYKSKKQPTIPSSTVGQSVTTLEGAANAAVILDDEDMERPRDIIPKMTLTDPNEAFTQVPEPKSQVE